LLDVGQIIAYKGQPDLLVFRHPGRMYTDEEFQQLVQRIEPWVKYSVQDRTTTLFSFFEWDIEGKDRLVKELINPYIDAADIRIIDKDRENRMSYYDSFTTTSYVPDFCGIRMF